WRAQAGAADLAPRAGYAVVERVVHRHAADGIGVESDVGIGPLSVGLRHQDPLVIGLGLETAQPTAAVAPADLSQPRAGRVDRQSRAADRQDVRRSSWVLRR